MKAPDFSLLGVDGEKILIEGFEKAKVLVVVFSYSVSHCTGL